VLTVRKDGPAEKAGIRPDDLIVGIGNRAVRSISDMATIVAASRPGERLEFSVERGGRRLMIGVVPTLRPPPEPEGGSRGGPEILPAPRTPVPRAPAPPPPDPEVPLADRPVLGIRVVPLDSDSRRNLPLLVRRGVVISSVDFASPAERAGLPVGGVIVAVDGRRIDSPEDIVSALEGARPGQEVEITYYHQRVAQRKRITLAGGAPDEPGRAAEPESDLPGLVPPAGRDDPAAPRERGGGVGGLLPGRTLPPAVRDVERLIDGMLRPGEPAPPPAAAAGGGGDVAELKAEVEILRRRLAQLEARLADLERRAGGAGGREE
jgi:hypothetical protein